ncbi:MULTISPECIES: ABC transporter ATP-binding protein [Micromonospora]|uniref:ABC transporter ATP-binding protein n=1 Tax=Micromonospora TaxID=1873 RepID=UPI00069EE2DE|nr:MULTISPECIES: ABC transporter ATP-binding protein [Micromonospora]MDG4750882.1 ABC transporter ATP-binding protein [Micromonospora sp. WMMD718]UFN96861.1 ABC transporter ATP-binding protein/permease [Micromonospora aurantiaca]
MTRSSGQINALRLLVGTAWRHARPDFLRSLLQSVAALALGALPWFVALAVAGIEQGDDTRFVIALVAIALCVFAGWVLRGVGATYHVSMAEKVSFAFERRLACISASLPTISHFDDPDFADQMQVLHQNKGRLGGGMSGLIQALDVIANALVLIVVSAVVDPRLLLLTLAVVPSWLGARLRLSWQQAAEDESAEAGRRAGHLRQLCLDPHHGMEVRVLGMRRGIVRRLRASLDAWQAPRLRAARRSALLTVLEDGLATTLVMGGTLCWLLYSLMQGTASVFVVVAAAVAARQIQQGLVQVVDAFGRIADTLQFVRRFQALSAYWRDHQRPAREIDARRGGIRLDGVSFSYPGSARRALDRIDLTIPDGSVVAVVGENGAGKSTLAYLLLGLYAPTEGTIAVNGTVVSDADPAAWQRLVTATFQDYTRPELTAREAVGLGDPPHLDDAARVARACADGGADLVVARLPHGLDTQLGAGWPGGVDLSGGQWQRIALARGMMRADVKLTVLDEPTAALDAHTENEIFDAYVARARSDSAADGITVLVTHRFSTVRSADRILVVDGGRIIEDGTHEALLRLGGTYAELYGIQARGYAP